MAMLPPDPIYIFKGEMTPVSCITFKFGNLIQRIFAGTETGDVHVWDLKTKREQGKFKAGESTCLSVCVPQQEETVVTLVKCGHVSFWNEQDNRWTLKKLVKIDFFGFCKCHAFEDFLYAPVKDSKLDLLSVKTMERTQTIALEDKCGDLMAFKICRMKGRKRVVVAHEGLKLSLWDLEEVKKLSDLPVDDCPMCVDYDPDANKGACGGAGDKITIFSFEENLEFKVARSVTLTNPGVAAVRIRPDGKVLAVGCWDARLRLYSMKSLVLLAVLDIHSSTVQDVTFSEGHEENSKVKYLLAGGSRDSGISLWDLYN